MGPPRGPTAAINQSRTTFAIATATAVTSLSVFLWFPLMPLFMLEVGARDDADAAFWVAIALSGQGVARLIGGPLRGLLSDRVGRKKMFVRALFATALTTLLMAFIRSPWQLTIALVVQGLAGGFSPAAIALASVSVPDDRLKSTLSLVSTGQYLGSALGPAVGALLVPALGYRGAIAGSALVVFAVTLAVAWMVPADRVAPRAKEHPDQQGAAWSDSGAAKAAMAPFRMTGQLAIAIAIYFLLFALNSFRFVSTSLALKQINAGNVTTFTGVAFALSGAASVVGIALVSSRLFRERRLRSILVWAIMMMAVAYFLQAASATAWLFVGAFCLVALLNATMFPATNTLIAMNTNRSRRGTAFGLASGAQALAFMTGPATAALFAATSLRAGFAAMGALLVCMGLVIAVSVREPGTAPG
jgi:DHA1 family multidrug resistance protein-like MFS transporter